MLLSLSDNLELLKRLEAIYFSNGMFSFFGSINNMSDFVDSKTNVIDFAIVDTNGSIKDARAACDKLRSLFSDVRIGLLTSKPLLTDGVFLISSRGELLEFLGEIKAKRSSVPNDRIFKIVPHEMNARLLGYPLRLTKNEHRILLLLASVPERVFSYNEIVSLAFPFSRDLSKNQLAVHVCNINHKASLISGRKLVLDPHKNGYLLNPKL